MKMNNISTSCGLKMIFLVLSLEWSLKFIGKLMYSATNIIWHFHSFISTSCLKLKIWRRLSFFFFFSLKRAMFYYVIKLCSQFNFSGSKKTFNSFAKNREDVIWRIQIICQHFDTNSLKLKVDWKILGWLWS